MDDKSQIVEGRMILDEDLGEVTRQLKAITEAPYLTDAMKKQQRDDVLDKYDSKH
jgi:hypothetical protein